MKHYRLVFTVTLGLEIVVLTFLFRANLANYFANITLKKDPSILSIDKMAEFLADLHIIDCLRDNYEENDLSEVNLDNYYLITLKKHMVTEEMISKSYSYYANHPKLLLIIYDKVISILKGVKNSHKEDEYGD